jgi:16S rRNA (uracil1498-N3)-methyltransferase
MEAAGMSDTHALPWFYHPHSLDSGVRIQLDADEARHASGARRLRVEQAVCLFDGRGRIAEGTIAAIGDRGRVVEVEIAAVRESVPAAPAVHLASAIPKGDRQAVLLDMATQLGVTSFTPLLCEHGVAQPGERAVERWRRICIEACKQSRRSWIPEIRLPATVAELMAAVAEPVWLAHVAGQAPEKLLGAVGSASAVTILIGPEGGFTAAEVAQAQSAGADIVGLGDGILRIETAAVSLLAWIRLARSE